MQPIIYYLMFHGTWPLWFHGILCFAIGMVISGYLYLRFMAVVQRSVEPGNDYIALDLRVVADFRVCLHRNRRSPGPLRPKQPNHR